MRSFVEESAELLEVELAVGAEALHKLQIIIQYYIIIIIIILYFNILIVEWIRNK